MKKGIGIEYALKYFTSDGAVQSKNTLSEVYDLDEVKYKNDLWHVEKNIKSNWNSYYFLSDQIY